MKQAIMDIIGWSLVAVAVCMLFAGVCLIAETITAGLGG